MSLQDDNSGDETNAEPSDQTTCAKKSVIRKDRIVVEESLTSDHDVKTGRGSLENATDAEDTAAHDDSHAATDEIGKVTSNDSTEEST